MSFFLGGNDSAAPVLVKHMAKDLVRGVPPLLPVGDDPPLDGGELEPPGDTGDAEMVLPAASAAAAAAAAAATAAAAAARDSFGDCSVAYERDVLVLPSDGKKAV